MKRSKTYRAAEEKIEEGKLYSPLEAVRLAKETAGTKFDSTVEVAMRLGVDPRKADQMVRGTVNLPNGTGKTARVLVFANGDKAAAAEAAGADFVGSDDLIARVQGGWTDFDAAVDELGFGDEGSGVFGEVGDEAVDLFRRKEARRAAADEHGRGAVAVTGGATALLPAELLAGAGDFRPFAGRARGAARLFTLPGDDAVQDVGARLDAEHGIVELDIALGLGIEGLDGELHRAQSFFASASSPSALAASGLSPSASA